MDTKFCQSCAMPLTDTSLLGTNADSSQNEDYCIYCFKDGKFLVDTSMDEFLEGCILHMTDMDPNDARKMLKEVFPTLKRWKNSK